MHDTTKRWIRSIAVAGVLLTTMTGVSACGDQQNDDRTQTDLQMTDVDTVKVFRNIDNFPNVECLTIRGLAFVTTSNRTGDSDTNAHGVSLVRVPEWDGKGCP